MTLSLFASVGAIHFAALMSPGPDFALVVRHSKERRAAVAAAIGIALGILFHSILSLTGVSLLIQNHAILFALVRSAGAAYLLWLGIGALNSLRRQSQPRQETAQLERTRFARALRDGLATNLLNPKALAFFIGLLAAMVTPDIPLMTRSLLVLELFLLSLLWFVPLAWLLSAPALRARLQSAERGITLVTGTIFTLVGASILISLLQSWPS
jgi:RhtB (resistance to homoserine/threonine) family protein